MRKSSWHPSRRSGRESSYFTNCKYCGVKIHLRQMEHQQWVAFDGKTRVHRCGQEGDYENLAGSSMRRQRRASSYFTLPSGGPQNNSEPQGPIAQITTTAEPQSWGKLLLAPSKWPSLIGELVVGVVTLFMGLLMVALLLATNYWWVVAIGAVAIYYLGK